MDKVIDDSFDFGLDGRSVFQLVPKVFNDERGWFAEMFRSEHNVIDIKQINRSCSRPGIIRGCHAQCGSFCQAKLVEAVNVDILDVITDARPHSNTFGKTKSYLLSAAKQNKLFVPRGFLHAFIVSHKLQEMAYFNYYCDNVYDKASEICINPKTVIPQAFANIENDFLFTDFNKNFDAYILTERDLSGKSLDVFLSEVKRKFESTKENWYE